MPIANVYLYAEDSGWQQSLNRGMKAQYGGDMTCLSNPIVRADPHNGLLGVLPTTAVQWHVRRTWQ